MTARTIEPHHPVVLVVDRGLSTLEAAEILEVDTTIIEQLIGRFHLQRTLRSNYANRGAA